MSDPDIAVCSLVHTMDAIPSDVCLTVAICCTINDAGSRRCSDSVHGGKIEMKMESIYPLFNVLYFENANNVSAKRSHYD